MKTERIEDFLEDFHLRMMKAGRITSIVCYIGMVVGLAVMMVGLLAIHEIEAIGTGGIVMAPFVIPLIAVLVNRFRFRSIENWPPYRLVMRQREEVVWVYFITTNLSFHGLPVGKTYRIALCGCNGKRVMLGLRKKVLEALAPTLASSFPHAALGWSENLEAAFKRNPGALRQPEKFFTRRPYSLVKARLQNEPQRDQTDGQRQPDNLSNDIE